MSVTAARGFRAAGVTAPVLALTASATPAERQQCERAGMAAAASGGRLMS